MSNPILSQCKTGQIAYILLPSSDIAQKLHVSLRITHLRKLVGLEWVADSKILSTASPPLVYLTAKHCTPVWCHSVHTCLIDSGLNDALHIVTECLLSSLRDHLPTFSNIHPAELCRLGATLSLAYRKSLDHDHILYGLLSGSSEVLQKKLRSGRPFVPAAQNLLNNLTEPGIRASGWTNYRWNAEYCKNSSKLRVFIARTNATLVEMNMTQKVWANLNRL